MTVTIALIYILVALGGLALFARGISMVAASYRLEGRIARGTAPSQLAAVRFELPNILTARGKDGREIVNKLQQAGFSSPDAVERFLWIRLGATLASLLLIGAVSWLVWGKVVAKPLFLLLGPAMTYLAAKRILLLIAGARQRAIVAEFPFLLDLMLMMLESGISLDQCLRSIAKDEASTAPKLNPSLRALVDDIDRGMTYDAALDRWATRVAVPACKDLASLFQQGLYQGIELSPALRQFAREFTERRLATAREAVGKIAVKMVVIMILFFMPALFVVVAGPPIAAITDTMKAMRE
jgi:tight adherence protein C